MIKNNFYSTEVSEGIKAILNTSLTELIAKTISVGGFELLPEPEYLNEYLPAVIIKPTETEVSGTINVNNQLIYFDIYYIYSYDFTQFQDIPLEARKGAETVANVLLGNRTLNGLKISPSETESGGEVRNFNVSTIKYDTAETQIFYQLDIPAAIAHISAAVEFLNYR